ncbi:hypothetical protein ANCDUO_22501, partial [Ancylostoma duodenale]
MLWPFTHLYINSDSKVIKYFKNGHNVLWPQVEQVLTNPKYANYKATFTGHSLGGALAALAAARTAKQ